MRLLLDTQCWLWMQASPEKLTDEVRELLVTQARLDGLTLLTADRTLGAYDVQIMWAS